MLEETEAISHILEHVTPGTVIWVPLELSLDSVLAQDIVGQLDSPHFDNSGMDGYAVRANEAAAGAQLLVQAEVQAAGPDLGLTLEHGHAIRIFTGASIPSGADAVIMQEDVERIGDHITIVEGVEVGENIRRRGGDIRAGQLLLQSGSSLTPARIGALASQGVPEVPVYARPLVEIITTGDEIVQPGDILTAGQIFNSNSPMIQAAVTRAGGVASASHVPDDTTALHTVIQRALDTADIVILVGGVSVGDRDFVKQVLEKLGVETDFWRVNIKPGKPFLYGRHPSGTRVFGLPGNPVSAYISFTLFVAPLLRRIVGREALTPTISAISTEQIENPGIRPHYMRGFVEEGKARLSGSQRSHAIYGLSQANCLIRLGPDEIVSPGDEVRCIPI